MRHGTRRSRREFGGLTVRGNAHDVPGQAGLLQSPDHPRGRIEVPSRQTMASRCGKRMMVVVPGLTEREERQPPDIPGLVTGLEAAAAEEVAQRVDAVRRVVEH